MSKAEASIACRQVGPIAFPKPLETQEEMFTERISLVFKKLRVVRMVDRKRNSLVYLTYSDRVIEGSPGGTLEAAEAAVRDSIPARRMGRPEELAAVAAFLCSAPASYVSGTAVLVDGALTRGM